MAIKYENNFPAVEKLIDSNVERALIASSELVRSQAKTNVTAAGRVDR